MDVERQLRKLAIDQLYNQKFKNFLFYRWVQSSIICKYNLGNRNRDKFLSNSKNS